ncbi:MAG: 8-oxo-dGTP diphosphatase [Crocinitomicaceae bacterium]|jgi:8-oxo-dGTP diphosphatase
MSNSDHRYNIRVYAIIFNDKDEVLVSDEPRHGVSFTKFPGGGLEWGEGTKECLKRELQEELELDASIGELFYVNDFFQVSAFRDTDQLISFYYLISEIDFEQIQCSEHPVPMIEEGEKFRWIKRAQISPDQMTFPVDKVVAEMLRDNVV